MKKAVLGLGAVLLVLLVWWWRRDAARPIAASAPGATTVAGWSGKRAADDPRKQARGELVGVVNNEAGAPVADAQVCASASSKDISDDDIAEPICVTTGSDGTFTVKDLFKADYALSAAKEGMIPAHYFPWADDPIKKKLVRFPLGAGETKRGIVLVLTSGGVEVTGTVTDIGSGPIANGRVTVSGSGRTVGNMVVRTDEQGRYRAWTAGGDVWVTVSADGYADGRGNGHAPGVIDVKLTPESGIAGTVRDSTGTPIAGVVVTAASGTARWDYEGSDISDESGRYAIRRLKPGRYAANATTPNGFGRSSPAVLVGLGQVVEGVDVTLHPASNVVGKVMVGKGTSAYPCPSPRVSLEEPIVPREAWGRSTDGTGVVSIDGVLPGTYKATIECDDAQTLKKQEVIVVAGRDTTGLVWTLDVGGTITGRVTTKAGAPVANATINARVVSGKGGWLGGGYDQTDNNGRYELRGLEAETYSLNVMADVGPAPDPSPTVALSAGATATQDITLDEGGTVRVTVTDEDGAPVKGATVMIWPVVRGSNRMRFFMGQNETDANGSYVRTGVTPGKQQVDVRGPGWTPLKKPGTTDDDEQGETVTVVAGQEVSVRLRVESQRGQITGVVKDATGAIIGDAFVTAVRESDSAGASKRSAVASSQWTWGDRSVLTDPTGEFEIKKLATAGKYTVRAYRKGGGDAIVEHVAVGSQVTLTIRSEASIAGTVMTSAGPPDEFTIEVADPVIRFSRDDKFFRTRGAFLIADLPPGTYAVTATASGATATQTVTLAEGEKRTGITLTVGGVVSVAGRVVDVATGAPVEGMTMIVRPALGGSDNWWSNNDQELTPADGKFVVERVPTGLVSVIGYAPGDAKEWGNVNTLRTIPADAKGVFDVGDIAVAALRVKKGQEAGDYGLTFQRFDDATVEHPVQVARIDPKGPAASLDIKVGDIVIAIDGIDIVGRSYLLRTLLNAPPGTTISLTFARGVTVKITLVEAIK